ncbi:sugar phosphate isomerase/epimerase [Rathayibacter sp. VKM Ac-2857]|uniref:sugar phosphate isomerase/epimerase family protein n=1 Tax=Rathayibacter sp. VKM Ac-2857 TaxID=2739020 RepID=UPI001565C696|nr:TIM barrel protein [Rathayibacter sp. VKM Ac-2857]NQX16869.1 sugar phosphate isomerase/epimerase [Rathayibacter sp. VKM Ac-2857]
MTGPRLVATCWTSAGAVGPLDVPERSPLPPLERLRAIADGGWAGFGFAHEDLIEVRDTIGFPALRAAIDAAGFEHVEVELVTDWFEDESVWRPRWEMLLEAAEILGAAFIKAGPPAGPPAPDLTPYVAPLRRLGEEAARIGTRVVLEPLPFSVIDTLPRGAELITAVGHPAVGLIVDYWHVFRAGTSLEVFAAAVPIEQVFGVELSDAPEEVVGTLFEDTRNNRTLLGEGAQDVAGFITTLRTMGYDGAWGVEIISDEHRSRDLTSALALAKASAEAAFARSA